MKHKEELVCDVRSGCVAIYQKSKENDTLGCDSQDLRNIAFSNKGATTISNKGANWKDSYWVMDEETVRLYRDMVYAYNLCLERGEI